MRHCARRVVAALLSAAGGMAALPSLAAGQATAAMDSASETAYARAITRIADSAMHRLDFFPARAQLRVQMLFLAAHDSVAPLFVEIGRRSEMAALRVDEIVSEFGSIRAPDDLRQMHVDLVASLNAARAALDRLGVSAMACQADVRSIARCQTPFTAASTALGVAYKRYLDTRGRIRDQIIDTRTVLPDFKLPASAGRAP
jgi:hypothetical protein